MANQTFPSSVNPAEIRSLSGLLNVFVRKALQNSDGCLPAEIISYDSTKNRAEVQPLIDVIDASGKVIQRAKIASVPVFKMGAGGFILNFPIKQGDKGWIVANDRDISIFLQNYQKSKPNTTRIKNFSDAFFIPDIMNNYTIAEEDINSVSLQSADGSIKITLSEDTITISAPNVVISSNTNFTGNVEISGTLGVNGATNLNNTLDVTGIVNLGNPSLPIARAGDPVAVNIATGIGTITSGGINKSS